MDIYKHKIKLTIILLGICFFIGNKSFSQSNNYKLETICIDAGHGGRGPGAITKRVYEKDIVLDVALRFGKLIESKYKDIKVVYTRKKDVSVGLYERAEIANKCNADLFISIHANSTKSPRAYGTETFVFGLNKTAANLKVAMKENGVIKYEKDYNTKYQGFDPSKPESYIMFNMVQNHHREQSIEFANYVESSFKKSGRHSRGVQEASLIVLIKTAMPAVLVELGFISNRKEERLLMSSKGKRKLASNLFEAFEKYRRKVEKRNNIVKKNTVKKIITKTPTIDLHYGVQIASGLHHVNLSKYRKFAKYGKVCEVKTGKRYRYYVKSNGSYSNVINLQRRIKSIQKDCFVIAINKGVRISLSKAKKIIN